MSSESAVPTYILQRDGLFREGLRLILSNTRFCPRDCAIELDDLSEVPCDRAVLFIVGVDGKDATTCSRIREQYPLAFVVAALAVVAGYVVLQNFQIDGLSAVKLTPRPKAASARGRANACKNRRHAR